MFRTIAMVSTPVALAIAAPAYADTYTQASFSGGIFGGGANVSSPFSGNGFFPGQTFTGSFVYDNQLVPGAGSNYVNIYPTAFPDAIPAATLFTFNFGPLIFTSADADAPFGIQYKNGAFNGFFYQNNFAFQGNDYQFDLQGGAFSVRLLSGGQPIGSSLVNGYVNIGDRAVTGKTPYTPVTNGAVPEPATWAMMIAGFGMIGGAMRRRAKVRVVYT